MSYFSDMTIVFGRNVTSDGGDFHTITVDNTHYSDVLQDVIDCMESAGYEVMSVVVDGYDFEEEVLKELGYSSNIVPLFDALCEDAYSADEIRVFILNDDAADLDNWNDRIWFSGSSYEEIVKEWAEVFHRVYEEVPGKNFAGSSFHAVDAIPEWVDVNWEETAHNIARNNSNQIVEFNGMIYMYSSY